MKFATLVSASSLLALAFADYGKPAPKCDVVTTTKSPYECPYSPKDCTVKACATQVPVTIRCGCSSISTTSICPTACPTGCAATEYITAIEDCFPTSTTTHGYASTTRYANTTTTTTSPGGYGTTITVCPKDKYCVSSTTTVSSAPHTTTSASSSSTTSASSTTSKSTTSATAKPTPTQQQTNDAAGHGGFAGVTFALVGGVFLAAVGLL